MQRFSGKAVVVTGAAQGIGRGVALAAAEEGAKVLLVDRAELVYEVQAEIAASEPQQTTWPPSGSDWVPYAPNTATTVGGLSLVFKDRKSVV